MSKFGYLLEQYRAEIIGREKDKIKAKEESAAQQEKIRFFRENYYRLAAGTGETLPLEDR